MPENILCLSCQNTIDPQWYFCPNCGKQLREKTANISLQKQLFMYAISFFLAPFGLVWGTKYIRSSDPKTKTVGIVIVALTILSLILMVTLFKAALDQYAKLLNNLSNGVGY